MTIAFTNARLVLPDSVTPGTLLVRDGVIAAVGTVDLPPTRRSSIAAASCSPPASSIAACSASIAKHVGAVVSSASR